MVVAVISAGNVAMVCWVITLVKLSPITTAG